MYRKTFIEIETENIQYNIKILTKNYPDYEYYIGVVKGNAYGHGYGVVPAMLSAGINFLAVSTLEEALDARKIAASTPILILQPIHIEELEIATQNNFSITVSSLEYFEKIKDLKFSQKIKVHLKVDTGLNRLGIKDKSGLEQIVSFLKNSEHFEPEGIYSHFATTGVFDNYWDKQLNNFKNLTESIDLNIFKVRHLGRSLTLLNHSKIPFCNAVRIGLLMYGINQSPSHKNTKNLKSFIKKIFYKQEQISETVTDHNYNFKTAFSLKSEVTEIKRVDKGEKVGYGAVYEVEKDGCIAIIPIGYADGFSKHNKGGYVFIKGKKNKIVSEVNMGMLTVFVDKSVKVGDEVELIGQNISLREVATRTQTTVYEVMCALQNTLPRIYK